MTLKINILKYLVRFKIRATPTQVILKSHLVKLPSSINCINVQNNTIFNRTCNWLTSYGRSSRSDEIAEGECFPISPHATNTYSLGIQYAVFNRSTPPSLSQ